ncbi:protease inhibitor I9 family protein [Neobacillus novalis]|uniref:Protease inhibitor I9 family protein n=1 Tax=Neobacillus novalis TaxID=220687 RepID=A0AA95SD58_9BACI|nr:protease inhibitor I9 family protein [Neobacillus novalis]WHY88454.1 protease inhibitor I9 family protein [Neobacillus novalis]
MRKGGKVLLVFCLLSLVGFGVFFSQNKRDKEVQTEPMEEQEEQEEPKGEEVVTQNIYIDPKINMNSPAEVTIIINFKTKPAKTAVALAEASGIPLTLEQAEQDVKDSHERFLKDSEKYLGEKQIPYRIVHTYTAALNGVAMKLPANEIQTLLQSAEIEAIYANREIKLVPPVQPS